MTNIIRKHENKDYESEIMPLFSGRILIIFFCLKSCNFYLNRLGPWTQAYIL